jgi:CPA2 family monovalent cation:H+ antiporter-2
MWDALAPLLSSLPSSWLPVVAAGTAPPVFEDIAVLGALSVGIAYLCYRLHLVPIAGFLIAGVVIGPHALGLVEDVELVNTLAEVGVILLLFTIGIEFSLDELSRIRRLLIGGGSLQVGGTIAVVTGLCLAFGVDVRSALFTGCLVALSSTAIVLGLLADRAETDTPHGQGALGILIFQDLAIIAMVLLMPLLGGQGGSTVDLLLALGKAIGLVVAVLLLARWAVPILLERVAATRRPELFLLTVVALCFGTAWVTSLAGVSLALGAFLAGLVVSESPYSTQALSEVLPLRTVFNAAFFVSVGMLLDIGVVVDILPLVLGGAVAVLLIKALVTTFSLLALRLPLRIATGTGLLLAQIGEFSFVLDIAGRQAGLTPAGLGETGQQAFIASTVLLMLLTPLLASVAPAFGRRLETAVRSLRRRVFGAPGGVDAAGGDGTADPAGLPLGLGGDGAAEEELSGHVVVVGYGPSGRRLTTVLQQASIPFVIVELNPRSVDEAREAGLRAVYGDATRPHVLEVAGLEDARCLVVAINDREATVRTVRQAHHERPDLQILARADFLDDVERLHDAGAQIVIPPELETAVRFFSEVLTSYDVPADEVRRHVRHVREHDYEVMRRDCSAPAEEAWDVLLDADGADDGRESGREGGREAGAPTGDDRPA